MASDGIVADTAARLFADLCDPQAPIQAAGDARKTRSLRCHREGHGNRAGAQAAPKGTRPHRFHRGKAANRATFENLDAFGTLVAPEPAIQGGTTDILRGIIARGPGRR